MMKKVYRGKYRILTSKKLTSEMHELKIVSADISRTASAGQFVNVYLPGGEMLLPRPIGITDTGGATLTITFAAIGKGTRALTHYRADDYVELMGPLGSGFFDYEGSPVDEAALLLIGGGSGVAPLLFAAREMIKKANGSAKITACLGFPREPWYREEFENVCNEVGISSEAEGMAEFHGNVVELVDSLYIPGKKERPVLALACGPRPMLEAAAKWCLARDIPLRVSMEERMGCGYGACAGCAVATRLLYDKNKPQNGPDTPDDNGIIKKKVCAHGPVFWADEVVW